MNYLIVAAFIVFALLLVTLATLKKSSVSTYKVRDIMTLNEVEFFNRLCSAVPNHHVFPQVSMSAILVPNIPTSSKRYLPAFRRISQKRIDWAVYTRNLDLVCLVELDDSTHNKKSDQTRDGYVSSAGIRTLRWHSKKKPDTFAIAAAISALSNNDSQI